MPRMESGDIRDAHLNECNIKPRYSFSVSLMMRHGLF